jgi:hypothetical protein
MVSRSYDLHRLWRIRDSFELETVLTDVAFHTRHPLPDIRHSTLDYRLNRDTFGTLWGRLKRRKSPVFTELGTL